MSKGQAVIVSKGVSLESEAPVHPSLRSVTPIYLRVQGATRGLKSTRRRASRHYEHPEIQKGDSDHQVNASTSQDKQYQQPLESALDDTDTNRAETL